MDLWSLLDEEKKEHEKVKKVKKKLNKLLINNLLQL